MVATNKFDKVKDYFDRGLWSISRVRDSVAKNWITPEQLFEITGVDYYDTEE